MKYPPLVATDANDANTRPIDWATCHQSGVIHRGCHVELLKNEDGVDKYFFWRRADATGRLDIVSGHCEWSEDEDRAESYEETAIRETWEELNLAANWDVTEQIAFSRLKSHLLPIGRVINQLPSSSGPTNNEWNMVYRLHWNVVEWGDPCNFVPSEEGHWAPSWMTVADVQAIALKNPMGVNAAVRLFLRRRDILVPLLAPEDVRQG